MKDIKLYVESGILEMYVLGQTSEIENSEIERLSELHPEIRTEIDQISESVLTLANNHPKSVSLNTDIKPYLMAVIDYTERLKNGEWPAVPPILNDQSTSADFSEWLNRADMIRDQEMGATYAKIIGYTPEAMTAIVWLDNGSPMEVHDAQLEKFLILEGSCDIITNDETFSLKQGSYFQIPLHVAHRVEVTSHVPCKLILQRAAA